MLGQDLPPIGAKLTGEISDLMAKLEIVSAKIKEMRAAAKDPIEIKVVEDLQKNAKSMAANMRKDIINKSLKDALKEADPEADKAGQSAAQRFAQGWKNAMKKENINTPAWLPWVGAAMPLAPSLISGLAGAVGGLAVGVGSAVAGLGALGAAATEVLGPVKQAFTTIDKLNTTNALAANSSALRTWLSQPPSLKLTGSTTPAQVRQRIAAEQLRITATQSRIAAAKTPASAASARATLMTEQGVLARYQAQLTPTKNTLGPGLGFLAKGGTGPDGEVLDWYTLSAKQKKAIVTASQSTTGMPTSEKALLSSLMQERQAYSGLNPGQQKALFQYTKFDQTLVKAQNKAQPAVLGVFGAGLGALEPVLKYITPLANTAAKALMPLIKEVGSDFKSSGFAGFMTELNKLAGSSISTIGKSLIAVGTGIGHIFEGIGKSGLAGSMLGDILKAANAFKNWTGGKGFTEFLGQMKSNAPTVMAILHNLLSVIGELIKNLSGGLGHLELTGLNLLLHMLADLAKLPLGGFLYNMAALILMFSKFGSLKLVGALWDMFYKTLGKMIALKFGTFIANMLGVETAGKKVGEVWSGIGNKILSGAKSALSAVGGLMQKGFSAVSGFVSGAASAVGSWAKAFGSQIASMVSSGWSFIVTLGKQLVAAATATAAWIAERAAATATFIAENVAMAVSATAAFIAENAATLGIVAGIVALVAAIVFLATHWRQVWNDIKHWAKDAWEFLTHGWGQWIFPELTAIRLAVAFLRDHWKAIWGDIKQIALDWWHWFGGAFVVDLVEWLVHKIPAAFDLAVQGVSKAWGAIKEAVMAPIDWVVRYVIDDTLIKAFDWVSSKVGGPTISPITIPGMATGGKITKGSGPTADDVLVRVSRNETILSANDSNMLSPLLSMIGVPGYARGGVPIPGNKMGKQRGTMNSFLGGIGSFFDKIVDVGKITAALVTGNSTALTNDFMQLIGSRSGSSGATKDMAKLLTAIPNTLVKAAVKFLIRDFGMGSSSSIVRYAESFIGKVPYLWGGTTPAGWDCSGFVKYVYDHFGYTSIPRTSEEQWQWVSHSKIPTPGGLAFFAGADGTQQNPGHVGIVVSNNRMVDAYGTGFGTRFNSILSSSGAISGFGTPPNGFKSSGKGKGVSVSGGVADWLTQAIHLTGAPMGWLPDLEWIQAHETDSLPNKTTVVNPNGGATGLMQVKPATYAAFGTAPGGIDNPVANAVAAIRYIMSQYGSPTSIPGIGSNRYQGYDSGGWLRNGTAGVNMGSPEAVLTPEQSEAFVQMARALASSSKGGFNPTRLNNLFHYWTSHYSKWISQHKPYDSLHGKALESYWEAHWNTWIKHNIGTAKGGSGGGAGGGGGHGHHHHPLTGKELAEHNLQHYYRTDQTRTDASLRKEEAYYIKEIGKYFKGADKARDDREVREQTRHLIDIKAEMAKLNTKIANAKAYQQSVLSSFSGYADLSNDTLGSAVIHGKNATPGQFLEYQQKQSLGNLKRFSTDLKKLTQMHAPAWLIQQIVGMGVDQGTQYADEIIQGGPALIKQLNATQQQINKEELGISRGAASSVYEGKYNTSKNFLAGLDKEKAHLEKLFADVGKVMGREAARWFDEERKRHRRLPKGQAKHMVAGGVITEPIYGVGASGQEYEFGENAPGVPEQVTPMVGGMMRRQGINVQVFTNEINPVYHAAMLGFELARRSG